MPAVDFGVSVQVRGLDQLERKLKAARQWAERPFAGEAALRIRDDFNREALEAFVTLGRSTGERWRPLSPEYARWKAEHYPSRPLMVRTGALSRSLTDPNNRNFVFAKGRGADKDKKLTIWTRLEYAKYHQQGTRRLPARPLFVANGEIAKRWASVMVDELEDVIKGA